MSTHGTTEPTHAEMAGIDGGEIDPAVKAGLLFLYWFLIF